jgi:replicative DNA helicase
MAQTQLPRHEECEKALLCAISLHPQILDEATFSSELFDYPRDMIFEHFAEVYTDHGVVSYSLLKASFSPDEIEAIGREAIAEVFGFSDAWQNWKFDYDLVVDAYHRRKAYEAASDFAKKCLDQEHHFGMGLEEAWLKYDLGVKKRNEDPETRVAARAAADKILDPFDHGDMMHVSGIAALDQALGFVVPGDMLVIGAQTSFGKTSLAHAMATHVAFDLQDRHVAIFSMEMKQIPVWERIFAARATVRMKDLREKSTSFEQKQKIAKFVETIPIGYPLVIDDSYIVDVNQILSKCRRLKRKNGLDMVIVDYLQLISPIALGKEANRQVEVAGISRKLKAMAAELNLVVVALSQLNDQGQLRESRAIGQDADFVLIIRTPPDSDEEFLREIRIEKARNGPKGKVPVEFFGEYVSFANRSA